VRSATARPTEIRKTKLSVFIPGDGDKLNRNFSETDARSFFVVAALAGFPVFLLSFFVQA
jgi:hypothetical protein